MAKFYTDKAPTPVFAVTFVSNREGIIPKEKAQTSNNKTATSTPQQNEEDITNPDFKSTDYKEGIEAGEKDLLNKIALVKKTQRNNPTADEKKRYDESLADYRKALREFRESNMPTFYGPSNSSIPTIPTKDSEYLIYSNLQIQKTDDPNDLSQQSNWYLREAEVELTRDWPIQKAKLIVTCKLLDNGSIPPLVEVENGFVWQKDKDSFVKLLPEGRFLSADDEVRIYAGYKNDQCISMNDLDKYPFDFTNLETTGDIPADSADGLQLQQLQAEKKAIEDALSTIKNSLTDPLAWYYSVLGVALILAGGAYLYGLATPAAVVTPVVPAATTATVVTPTITTTVIAPAVAPAPASIALQQASIAGTRISGPVLQTVYNQAYNAAIKAGLGATAAASAALLAQQSVNAEITNPNQTKQASEPFKAKLRDYLDGRRTFNDNKELISLLEGELESVNNLRRASK